MSDVLRALDAHLADLAGGSVLARDKPTALQHGLLRSARDELERLQDLLDAAQGNWDREVDELMEQLERLRAALLSLRNEAYGVVGMPGMREMVGNTNMACLGRRIDEADALLKADTQAAPEPDAE